MHIRGGVNPSSPSRQDEASAPPRSAKRFVRRSITDTRRSEGPRQCWPVRAATVLEWRSRTPVWSARMLRLSHLAGRIIASSGVTAKRSCGSPRPVHPPVPDPCLAQRVPSHPARRPAGQLGAQGQHHNGPRLALRPAACPVPTHRNQRPRRSRSPCANRALVALARCAVMEGEKIVRTLGALWVGVAFWFPRLRNRSN